MFIPVLLPTPTGTTLGAAWAAVLDGILAILGYHVARPPALGTPLGPAIAQAQRYLLATLNRIDRLVRRWQAGTLPPPRTRPGRPPRASDPDRPRLRTSRFWLIHLAQPTAQYAPRIEHLLAEPDTRALAAAAPQAGRLLRPLCRGFDIAQPDWLRLPPRPRKPRPAPPPKPATPRLPPSYIRGMDPAIDRPLPANIIAAVRFYRKRGW